MSTATLRRAIPSRCAVKRYACGTFQLRIGWWTFKIAFNPVESLPVWLICIFVETALTAPHRASHGLAASIGAMERF